MSESRSLSMRSKAMLFIGAGSLAAIAIYGFFRVPLFIASLANAPSFFATTAIIVFGIGEIFIIFHAIGYALSIFTAVLGYRRFEVAYTKPIYPAVTILIPLHDEPIEVVQKTVIACRYVDYAPCRVLLVDASTTKTANRALERLATTMHVDYFLVPSPRHGAKAGSINEALKNVRTPYIAIFDADYRPSRDFLKRTIPQLEADKRLAFIQTPQFYGNISSSLISRAAELQQAIFYEYICEAKSVHNAMFICGTNVILRTKALRSVGGFDETSITEDFSTSIPLFQQGWRSRYYNFTTAFGDGPLNLREYLRQQYRWSRGTVGVFFNRLGTLVNPGSGLSFMQRLETVLSGSFYAVGLVWLVLILTPIAYILTGLSVYPANPLFYLVGYAPFFIFSIFFFFETLLSRSYRIADWIRAESLTILAVPVYAMATINALLNIPSTFQKTAKDAPIDEIPWDILFPQLFLFALLMVAIAVGGIKLYLFGWNGALLVNMFWCLLHALLGSLLIIELYVKNRSSQRRRA